jgi:hypothetical protein
MIVLIADGFDRRVGNNSSINCFEWKWQGLMRRVQATGLKSLARQAQVTGASCLRFPARVHWDLVQANKSANPQCQHLTGGASAVMERICGDTQTTTPKTKHGAARRKEKEKA